ncbi:hypothetical protein Maq22A_1p38445 (plasmid) [Methylobacterium aquaticum]|uniref:Uncharacterized protein n=1 Tax=Methylobacterium aquaticum TaxID=270351 RepID=A0A1Y0ZCP9_9HYPH|nr:hypothetical protein Maq22A_1p38445 [Methylobacterium aquaticum]
MRKVTALSEALIVLASPVLAQGRPTGSSTAASGNAEENNKPRSSATCGGAGGSGGQ